ncbi:MAG TPA: HAD-IC family P-type ATPase [Anaerolineaceae bacterium]|jgi:Ca2+-transporting ATPase|nr:cation-transporting P-type ATPase [Anaerolineaceae bacterium]HOE35399.1 HAD-IC family P-type ATPase [Anaerolineaceae bacterium]HQK02916.1 HAD-IC family P-type ATPase [Anaerolineaceae bacterium]HQL28176.1 HAD-IC family P-type ATPase [Anaerolineaceae bacterium]
MHNSFVTVIRKDSPGNIPDSELKLGDIVLIHTGDFIPADLRLVESRALEVDEFDITGELLPVLKLLSSDDVFVWMGSRVVRGSGKGIVVALGEETVYGSILKQVMYKDPSTTHLPLSINHPENLLLLLPAFGLSFFQTDHKVAIILLYLVFFLLFAFFHMDGLLKSLLLEQERRIFEKKKILIRNVNSIPVLKKIDTICFDKTGVITTRHVELSKIYWTSTLTEIDARTVAGVSAIPALIIEAAALTTDISFFEKAEFADPIDFALVTFAKRAGFNINDISCRYERILDLPFDSEKRYMASGYATKDQQRMYFLKGEPSLVLQMCRYYYENEEEKRELDFNFRNRIRELSRSISQAGNTPIAMAVTKGDVAVNTNNFTFLCLAQFDNSLQEGAKEVVKAAILKGIRPILLTGDNADAALRIALESGISQNSTVSLSGKVIEKMDLNEVSRQIEYCSVFSRLLPAQKSMIIRQLQKRGHRVLMVGDGPNDGIALNTADIGVSFTRDSSPIARKYSSILLNHLRALPLLLEQPSIYWIGLKWVRCLKKIITVLAYAVAFFVTFYR